MGIAAISSKLPEARWWETSPNGKLHGDRGALANTAAWGHRTSPRAAMTPALSAKHAFRLRDHSAGIGEARPPNGHRRRATTSTGRPFNINVDVAGCFGQKRGL
jgi:hypothetical protein